MMITESVIKSMFKHLTASFSAEEAVDILMQKYPDMENEILNLQTISAQFVTTETVSDQLLAAVKAKAGSKPKKQDTEKKITKADQARELYDSLEDKSRKAVISAFVNQLGMSAAMASTYYYSCKE